MSEQGKEDRFLPLVLEDLPESLKQKARVELCETEEAVRDGLKELKKLIKGKFSSEMCEPDDIMRALQVLIHFVFQFPASQVSGVSMISDAKVESLQTIQLVFRYVKFVLPGLTAFPARFQSLSVKNTNVVFRTLFAVIRPLIPSKLVGRIIVHDSSDKALLADYDASILPTEFGGTMGPLSKVSVHYINEIEEYIPTLRATNRYFKRKDTVPFPDS